MPKIYLIAKKKNGERNLFFLFLSAYFFSY